KFNTDNWNCAKCQSSGGNFYWIFFILIFCSEQFKKNPKFSIKNSSEKLKNPVALFSVATTNKKCIEIC
ncbi:hypothetical protein DOY81_007468, partial [Sarcophaga bullata]